MGEPSCYIDREEFSAGYPVYSIVFICPGCLRIWAGLLELDRKDHQIQATPCVDCPQLCSEILSPVAGSIIDNLLMNGVDWGLLGLLPHELLLREFNLHIKAYLNEPTLQHTDNSTAADRTLPTPGRECSP
jgi:hypothetical protein